MLNALWIILPVFLRVIFVLVDRFIEVFAGCFAQSMMQDDEKSIQWREAVAS